MLYVVDCCCSESPEECRHWHDAGHRSRRTFCILFGIWRNTTAGKIIIYKSHIPLLTGNPGQRMWEEETREILYNVMLTFSPVVS